MVRLYKWSRLDEVMDTQYGRITIYEWLRREESRIKSDPSREAIVTHRGGLGTLLVDEPSDLR